MAVIEDVTTAAETCGIELTADSLAKIEAMPATEQRRLAATMKFFGVPEELHPDLQAYVETGQKFGTCIRHPLVYSLMHGEHLNYMVNRQLEAKRRAIEEAMSERDFRSVVWLHERPWRLRAFEQVADDLSDHHYWQMLGDLWVDSENIVQNYADWHETLHADRPRRWAFMDKPERDKLRTLRKAPVLIYRGFCYVEGQIGMSWTLSRPKAVWFAQRFAEMDDKTTATVAVGVVDHGHIIAYKASRGEDEIVVDPDDVHVLRLEAV